MIPFAHSEAWESLDLWDHRLVPNSSDFLQPPPGVLLVTQQLTGFSYLRRLRQQEGTVVNWEEQIFGTNRYHLYNGGQSI